MPNSRAIWKHEVNQAAKVAHNLIERDRVKSGWKKFFLPFLFHDYMRFRKSLNLTRKNLLFTKRLAFDAAKEISRGQARAEEIRWIEIETKKLLKKERKGYYTEKVRRKQLHEIEVLVDHYIGLLNSNKTQYSEMVIVTYETAKNYLAFLNKLHNVEQEVIKATLATMRKGSKKERFSWFRKVQEASKQVRMEEAASIFPER
jgi:hypothetical protein